MIRTRGSKVNTAKWYNSGSAILNRTVPTLYHDFANQRYYDTALGETAFPYTSVHRSSNAMQFDANGNLVWADANMYNRSNDMAGASWSKNACTLTETGVEVSPTGDKVYKHVVNAATSTIGNDAVGGTWQVISSFPGSAIVAFSFYAKAGEMTSLRMREQITTGTRYNIDLITGIVTHEFGSTVGMTVSTQSAGNGWWRIMWKYTVASAATTTNFAVKGGFDTGDGTSGFYVSSFQHEMWGPDSPKRYLSSGASASGIYGPRFDYDPFTHEPLGILIEQSRSNDVTTSFLLNGSTGVFQTGVGSNGPEYLGGWSSARYTGVGTFTGHFFYTGSVVPGASTSRCVSAIFAYVDTQYLQIATSSNWPLDAANTYLNIDAISGTITAAGSAVTDTFIRKLADNVYHAGFTCVTSAAPTSGAGTIVGAIPASTSGRLASYDHTGSFDIIYLDNCAGSGWNSVTPSYATVSTRGADTVSMSTGAWLNAAAGTLYVDFERGIVNPVSGLSGIFARLYTDSNNHFSLLSGSGTHRQHRFDIVNGGVAQAQIQTSVSVAAFQRRKMAGAYELNLFRASESGASGTNDTSGTLPTVNALIVGSGNTTNSHINGWVREVRYYNTSSPSNAQLQTLTT